MILIDKYAYINRLKEVHPLEKMTLAFTLLLFSLAARNMIISLITIIVMSALTIFRAKIPISYYLKLLLLPGIFLLSASATILISFAPIDTSLMNIWLAWNVGNFQIYISKDHVKTVVHLLVVVFSSISCLYFLTLTTPMNDILLILRKMRFPLLLLEIMELTYRFIFIFLESAIEIHQAQASRLGHSTAFRGIRSLGMLSSFLFIGVFKRAQELTMAMNARGYQEEIAFYNESYRFSPINWLIYILILVFLIVIYVNIGGIFS